MRSDSLIGRRQRAVYLLIVPFLISLSGKCAAQETPHSVGVAPYSAPRPAHVHLIFGYGGNAGLGGHTPSSFLGSASYGSGGEWLAGFLTSTSVTTDLPRRSYSEFDLMYGFSFDQQLDHYEGPFDGLHTSIAAGISLDAYQERWRPYGRRSFQDLYYPPTTFQVSLGVPVHFLAVYEPFRYAGIGALLFYNVSTFSPSYGAALVVEARY